MDKKFGFSIAILGYILPIVFLIYIYFNDKILIPKGYELAIDSYVMSKNLILIFTFYLISKLGVFLYRHTKQD
nr:hypothetical protein [uncultured Bacillus sp.]